MSKPKPWGYWMNVENALLEVKRIMKKEGWKNFPGQKTLDDRGYSGLSNGIVKYHGGFHKVRELLGEEQVYGNWKKKDYALAQANRIMQKEGWTELPCTNILCERNYSSLVHAIHKYYGGMTGFRKLLGQKQRKVPNGSWQSLDYTLVEAQKIIEREGWDNLPGADTLSVKGYARLSNSISKHHGGFPHFRGLLQQRKSGRTEAQQLTSLLREYSGGQNE